MSDDGMDGRDEPVLREAQDLGDVVGRLHRAVRRAVARTGGGSGLPDAQVDLLRLVERRPGIGVKAAAESLRAAPNTVSTLVGELADAGLLERVRAPEDRRAVRLALTAEARRRLSAYRAHRGRLLAGVLTRLDPASRAELDRAAPHLARLAELIDAMDAIDAGSPAVAEPAPTERRASVPEGGTGPADAPARAVP